MARLVGDIKEYRWETGYEKSWEEIRDDGDGLGISSLSGSLSALERRRKMQQTDKIVRLGMMRHLNIIVDCSDSMMDQDLKPTRHMCTFKLMRKFIKEYLEQNPISQIGIIVTRNKKSERISDLSGNLRKHLPNIDLCLNQDYCSGEPSLQNSLNLALSSLRMLPSHTSREILVIFGSLTTCDPGNIKETIDELRVQGVKVSVIGLCAEVYVLKTLCNATKGQYHVILDDNHFQEVLLSYVKPRSVSKETEATCVKMGFPRQMEKALPVTYCLCHPDEGVISKNGYFCPQCNSKYCDLPVECATCGITLVTSAHLVRPLHHLIPIQSFQEIDFDNDTPLECYGCQKIILENSDQPSECSDCKQIYCSDCDLFIHNSLHMCPGCTVHSKQQ